MDFDILDFEKTVPKGLVDFYVEKLELKSDRRSIISMYNSLNEDNQDIVKQLYSEYCYAGKTAVNIFEETTLPTGFLKKEKMISILQKELGRKDIFKKEFRPPLSEEPQINWVEDRGDTLLIQFVSKGKSRRIRNGYEIIEVESIEFEFAIVHFLGPVIIELRCAFNQHSKYLSSFESFFLPLIEGEESRKFNWIPITKVSNTEAEKIASILSAGLVEADHKDDGIYDRHIVTASPKVRDLRLQAEYTQQFKNKMLLSQVLVIDYEDQTDYGIYTTNIKFKINLNTGFQFLSKVSEAAINYVMNVFLDVRYKPEEHIDETSTSEECTIDAPFNEVSNEVAVDV